jgi:hypothetical protein
MPIPNEGAGKILSPTIEAYSNRTIMPSVDLNNCTTGHLPLYQTAQELLGFAPAWRVVLRRIDTEQPYLK